MKPTNETGVTDSPEDIARGSLQQHGSVTKLDGYRAAGILIERMLNEATLKCPKRMARIKTKSAEYRAGAYQAILTAHCLMVYGEHPTHELNAPVILKTLKSLNAPHERTLDK